MSEYATDVTFTPEATGDVVGNCPVLGIEIRSPGLEGAVKVLQGAMAQKLRKREANGETVHPSCSILSADPQKIVGQLTVRY